MLIFLGLTYSFLLEQVFYNNHYYLFILASFLMIVVKGNCGFKLYLLPKPAVKLTSDSVPHWNILLFQFQIFILYFFGGIAKINQEWLIYAQPIQTWLPDMIGEQNHQNLSENLREAISYFLAYSGLLIDLLAGFLLFGKRTFKYAASVLVLFHLSNAIMFDIGLFPWFGICSLIIFVPDNFLNRWNKKMSIEYSTPLKKKLVTAFIIFWILFQFIFPLRHKIIPGWVMWDERGFKFSWFMKLRTKEPTISIKLNFEGDERDYFVDTRDLLTKKQGRTIAYKPMLMVQFAHKLEEYYQTNGTDGDVKVYAEIYNQLHEHAPQLVIDTTIDLTTLDIKNKLNIGSQDWIYPFDPYAQY